MTVVENQTKLWFDISTCRSFTGRNPVGLSRLEMNMIRVALLLPEQRVRFCYLAAKTGQFREIGHAEARAILKMFGSSRQAGSKGKNSAVAKNKNKSVRELFRALERTLRRTIRGQRSAGRPATLPGNDRTPFQPGDTLVISGAIWHTVDVDAFEAQLRAGNVQLIAILADLIPWLFPQFYQAVPNSATFVKYVHMLARYASKVISISDSACDDFCRFATEHQLVCQRPAKVTLGSDFSSIEPVRPETLPAALEQRKFVLCVSTIQVRKNHQLLYNVWRRLRETDGAAAPYLVLVGAVGRMVNDLVYLMQNDPLTRDRIIFLKDTGDAQLAWLYDRCHFTVYPSQYEGWGLPIVESLEYGKACLASNSSSMPEASQGLAKHIHPMNSEEWFTTVRQWIQDDSLVQTAQREIRHRYQRHTWEDFISDMVSLLSPAHAVERSEAA